MMQTCKECGASFPEEMTACPACGEKAPVTEAVPKQIPKQYPKQYPKERGVFIDTPPEEPISENGKVIICPKCGSEEVYLMENRAPTEREKNVLMACTHCRRTFHGPAYYDSKIQSRKKGILFFSLMAALTAMGLAVLPIFGQLTAFLPGTILGAVTLAVSVGGIVLYAARAAHWKAEQAKCYKPNSKGGAKS